jgi:hypothetical protein
MQGGRQWFREWERCASVDALKQLEETKIKMAISRVVEPRISDNLMNHVQMHVLKKKNFR